jgi:hypothetical protein
LIGVPATTPIDGAITQPHDEPVKALTVPGQPGLVAALGWYLDLVNFVAVGSRSDWIEANHRRVVQI